MKIQFCDVCNESVPLADVDEGRAVLRGERVICARCEAAMSASALVEPAGPVPSVRIDPAPARGLPAAAPLVHPLPRPARSAAPLGVALAIVALLAVLGGGFFLHDRLERRARELEEELARVSASIDERARLASGGLAQEMRAATEGIGQVQGSLADLSRRLEEAAQERAAAHDALRAEVEQISARMVTVDTVESSLERHAAELDDLDRLGSELRSELDAVAERIGTIARAKADPAADPAAAGAPEGANAPVWVNWLADLSSPDSGTRWQAVQSLGATGDPSVATHLIPMLGDSDIFVRMAAARILGELGAIEAIPRLIDALEDPEMSVREQAFVSLRKVSGQSLPFDPDGKDVDRAKRVKAWRDWWERSRDQHTSVKERRSS